ncbi:DIL domain containing protein, partial [Sarcoptes scabiei]
MKNNQFNEQSEFFVNEIDNLEATQSLKNFDLTNFNPLLKDLIIYIYLTVLENQELSIEKREQNSDSDSGPPSPSETEIQCLFRELSNVRALFSMHQLDERFVFQFFRQIYFFIGCTALNHLTIRKDLCNKERAMEIIYNLSLLEQFLRENNVLNWEAIKSKLDPILQATRLLISIKTEKQIPAIESTTEAL